MHWNFPVNVFSSFDFVSWIPPGKSLKFDYKKTIGASQGAHKKKTYSCKNVIKYCCTNIFA